MHVRMKIMTAGGRRFEVRGSEMSHLYLMRDDIKNSEAF